jgi:hypothetical protein
MVDRRVFVTIAVLAAALVPAASATADTLAPPPPSQLSGPPSPGNDTTPAWTWTTDATATGYECHLERADDPGPVNWQSCASGVPFTTLTAGDGLYRMGVRAVLGPLTSDEVPDSYTLDTTAPDPPVVTDGPAGEISGDFTSFTFISEPGSSTECRLDREGAAVFGWSACTSPWAYGFTGLPDGSYTFSVHAKDAAGNPSGDTTRWFTLARPTPTVELPAPAAPAGPSGPVLRAGVCINLFNGTPRADKLSGSPFGDVLLGFAGNDQLAGLGGSDCVIGSQGDDRLDGGAGDDDVRGQAGDDMVRGGPGADTLTGGPGHDSLDGGAGNDNLDGGPGTDRLKGGAGNDTINAADGRRESVDCGAGRDSVTADRIDRLVGCEKKTLRGRK